MIIWIAYIVSFILLLVYPYMIFAVLPMSLGAVLLIAVSMAAGCFIASEIRKCDR